MKNRIIGYDLARALALFGMVIVNFKIVMGAADNGAPWLVYLTGLLDGRAAATFVLLAGIGISLLSGSARRSNAPKATVPIRNTLLKRALFLFVVGLILHVERRICILMVLPIQAWTNRDADAISHRKKAAPGTVVNASSGARYSTTICTIDYSGSHRLLSAICKRMNNRIPYELEERVQRELESGERIQWKEMPMPHYFSTASTGAFLFAIPWTAFAIFWMFGASQSGSIAFTSFGIPFVLVGIGMLSSPFWTYRKSLKTIYVITDRRAITFDGGRSVTVRSYEPERLQNIFRKEKKDGSGDVIIAHKEWRDSDGDKQREELGFIRIKEPKKVEAMLKKLAEPKT